MHNVTTSESDASLVESIIAMAVNLGIKVVPEGIETEEQLAFVRKAGCNVGQGYGLGRPVLLGEFLDTVVTVARGREATVHDVWLGVSPGHG